jgi:hypothetical protein
MTLSVSITVLLFGSVARPSSEGVAGKSSVVTPGVTRGEEKTRGSRYMGRANRASLPFALLRRAKHRSEILTHYREDSRIAATLREWNGAIQDDLVLALSFDIGSGGYVPYALVYRKRGESWSLWHLQRPHKGDLAFEFERAGGANLRVVAQRMQPTGSIERHTAHVLRGR